MTVDIERVKFEMLLAQERDGRVSIARWLAKYPEFRDELLEFWLWMYPNTEDGPSSSIPSSSTIRELEDAAIHRACLAASLGLEWLGPLAAEGRAKRVAEGVRYLRSQAPVTVPLNRKAFRRAAVYSWVAGRLCASRGTASRLAVQKTVYVVEQALGLRLFDEHKQMPLGPYDHGARYRDAEPIAKRNLWLNISAGTLSIGPHFQQCERYAKTYLRDEQLAIDVVRVLANRSDEELELLATVLWVAKDLKAQHVRPGIALIRTELEGSKTWAPKLARSAFNTIGIGAALHCLEGMGLIQ